MTPSQECWHVHNHHGGSHMHQQFSSVPQKTRAAVPSEVPAEVWPAGCQDIVLIQSSQDAETVPQTENNYTFTAVIPDEQS